MKKISDINNNLHSPASCLFVYFSYKEKRERSKIQFIYLILLLVTLFASCEKDDKAITLPPPGDLKNATTTMGINYDNQVYFSFGSGEAVTKPYRIYDLAFEASANGSRVYLNTAKSMF